MSDARVTLEEREDGGWYAPCGCRFDYFDGRPEYRGDIGGKDLLLGKVAPHMHIAADCTRHQQPAAETLPTIEEVSGAVDFGGPLETHPIYHADTETLRDEAIVNAYRLYSEENWASGWFQPSAKTAADFGEWYVGTYANRKLEEYEVEDLPLLREAIVAALAAKDGA